MPCCPTLQIPFNDAPTTTIAYTPPLQQQFGPTPRVYVWYYEPETGDFLQSSFFTLVSFADGNVVVDHGGPQSGIIVIR
jgi:hypothetical protein